MSALDRCLQEEASAISSCAKRLDDHQVEKALDLLDTCFKSKSKVIITGVGKSGIVARKIAATFSSIGLMAIYLNPLDALHGDLGVVSQEDICLLLSNSGETLELLEILPHLKKRGNSCIALVGNSKSTLAINCDVFLETYVDREVCPLNLAPTASTAVTMAIGDALASVWMQRNGISSVDFAINHPAGSLGKKLTLKVEDIMIPVKDIKPLKKITNFLDVISRITADGIGSGWVEDPECKGKILGLITDGDLRRGLKVKKFDDWGELVAEDLMNLDPITIYPDALAVEALNLMEQNHKKPISVLPVVKETNIMVGLLRLHDLVQSGLSQ